MNRSTMRGFARRRLNDLLSGSGQVFEDDPLNEELNEALIEVAIDVALEADLWMLTGTQRITLAATCQQYRLNPDFLVDREVTRVDLTPPVPCRKLDRRDLPNQRASYANPRMRSTGAYSEGYAGESYSLGDGGVDYTLGADDSGYPALLLPFAPTQSAVLLMDYIRTPRPLTDDTQEPFDIPKPLHRLVPLTAARNLIGPDQDGGGAYQVITIEINEVRRRGLKLLGRTYQPQFVEDVEG